MPYDQDAIEAAIAERDGAPPVRLGWLNPALIERARRRVTTEMFRVEYDLGEPRAEGRALFSGVTDRVFVKPWARRREIEAAPAPVETWILALPKVDHYNPELDGWAGDPDVVLIFEEPLREGRYATGVDWAKDQDWTIIVTLRYDVTPWRVVAWERRGRKTWPMMQRDADARMRLYGGVAFHDKTGVGAVMDDYLEEHMDGLDWRERRRIEDMLSDYLAGLENERLVCPWISYAEYEHRTASWDDIYKFNRGHRPDTVAAAAMAVLAAEELGGGDWFPYDEADVASGGRRRDTDMGGAALPRPDTY